MRLRRAGPPPRSGGGVPGRPSAGNHGGRRPVTSAPAAAARLRASPHVLGYWREGRFVVHHIPTNTALAAHPLVAQILQFFQEPRPPEALLASCPAARRAQVRRAVARLAAASFLQPCDGGAPGEELGPWSRWGPAAAFFHFATKDSKWARGPRLQALEAELEVKGRRAAPPPPVKRYPGAPLVALPAPPARGEFAEVLLGRRTWRGFGSKPLPQAALAQLLDLTWGVRGWAEAGEADRVPLKTSPSGGARHPIEAYVMALRVEGLPRGLYHYAADAHALERIRAGATARQLEAYLSGQWWYRPASALMLMTAVVPRVQWRYPFARAYRSVLLEAGHLCQTFCLVATWLGLAPFCTMALADSRIERDLQIDGLEEVVLYAAGVGTRPADGRWRQWPERHAPGQPYLPPTAEARRRPRRSRTGTAPPARGPGRGARRGRP